ncbi:hypothetical protein NIES2104_45080 [Leptolyngbya sp. NIES-2104]|nr:hypothetical protein NIES2104_45080 [Leptolyngbya sp. NIES-2104]
MRYSTEKLSIAISHSLTCFFTIDLIGFPTLFPLKVDS